MFGNAHKYDALVFVVLEFFDFTIAVQIRQSRAVCWGVQSWMPDAFIGICVTSCDQSVAGAEKGNYQTGHDTIALAEQSEARGRVDAPVVQAPSNFRGRGGPVSRGRFCDGNRVLTELRELAA